MSGQGRWGFRYLKPKGFQLGSNAGSLGGADVAQQQVLIGGETNLQLVSLHQLPEPCLELSVQATAEQGQSHKPHPSLLPMPAEVVQQLGLRLIAQPLEGSLEVGHTKGFAEPLDALVVQQVLHAGVLAHLPIPVVPLQRQDRLNHIENVGGIDVTQGIRCASEGLLLVVGATHATAHVDVAAPQFAGGVGEGNQADVLGEQINGVVPWHGDGHLELPGQVGIPVERFLSAAGKNAAFALALSGLLNGSAGLEAITQVTIHPEVEIGPLGRLGAEQIGNFIGEAPCHGIAAFLKRSWGCHHVAVDIPAGRQGRAHVANDGADHLFQIGLGDAVHLEGLTGGGSQGSIPKAVGQVIEGEEQPGRDASSRTAQPQHHLPTADLVCFAQFAVVLLVAAVKLQQLNGIFREANVVVAEFAQQRVAQMVAVQLALLRLGQRLSS